MFLPDPPSDANPVPSPRTLLDPLETNLQTQVNAALPLCVEDRGQGEGRPPRQDLVDVLFRHTGWAPTRNRVWRALQDADVSQARLDTFEECGHHAWVLESATNPGEYRIAADKCHDRFCGPCGAERSRIIATNVITRIGKETARFLTLTLKARSEPLTDTITRLYRAFARLRTRRLWQNAVTGGVAFLEVKRSSDCNHWHVHLHALIQGKYLCRRAVSKAWKQITEDSYIVDVRMVKDSATASRYVAKYASKPLDPTTTRSHAALVECITALKGRRLCLTFGDWRGIVLTELPDSDEWIAVAPLPEILARAENGDGEARSILDHLRGNNPCQSPRPPPKSCTQGDVPGQQQLDWTDALSVPTVPPF